MKLTPLYLVVLAGSWLAASAQAQTIGYWRFENGTPPNAATGAGSVVDYSGFNRDATPFGGPLYSSDTAPEAPGIVSLDFGGSDQVTVSNAAFNTANPFIVDFWMKSSDTGAGQNLLVDKSHTSLGGEYSGWLFQSAIDGGTEVVQFGIGTGTEFVLISSEDSLFDGEWHYLVGVYDGDSIEFFVDGVSQGTAAGTYNPNNGALYMGNHFQQTTRWYNGLLDEVRVTIIPEPGTAGLLLLGGALVQIRNRRNRRKRL